MKKVCIVGASGKLGQYMIRHALDLDYQISAVCRKQSVEKLDAFKERIAIFPGATNDHGVIKEAVTNLFGLSSVGVILKKVRVRGCQYGANTQVTRY